MNCYPFIEAEEQGDHSVKCACELLQVSRAATTPTAPGDRLAVCSATPS
ncbi:hypothetical protein [Kribbella sp. CA-294648]